MAVPFDLQRLEVDRRRGGSDCRRDAGGEYAQRMAESGAGQFSVSESGSLLYVPGGIFPAPERSVVWVNRSTAPSSRCRCPHARMRTPRLSPTGSAWPSGLKGTGTSGRSTCPWNVDAADVRGRNARAIWTPDGTRITYGSSTAGFENIFWKPADGSGPAERLTTSTYQQYAQSWSADGQTLLLRGVPSRRRYWTSGPFPSRGPSRKVRPFLQTRFNESYRGILARRTLGGVCVGRIRSQRSVRAALSGSGTAAAGVDRWWHRAGLVARRTGTLLHDRTIDWAGRQASPR